MTDPVVSADPAAGASDSDAADEAVADAGDGEVTSEEAPREEASDDSDEESAPARKFPAPEEESTVDEHGYEWFVLKVTSNREKTVKKSLEKRIRREGLEEDFGEIVIPTQKVVDPKGGKKRVIEQKLFPGYMMIQMKLNDDSWYLVRDTTGVGGFTGSSGSFTSADDRPAAMRPDEVARMLGTGEEAEGEEAEPAKVQIDLPIGETVKIKEGPFETFEGTVEAIDELHGKVTVLIEIFGSPRPTEFEYWQVEKV
ncbi:Transcription termination/antitermination protein NusG [Planctomycetes bacterium LzC2]|uniref:Transcription termination/antitermination protein NusG n=1 Tax=Alienimonas chondri TaxID=2681879 RepID=A0ABX1VDN2_9PLAN|nr:Transcription termination/antitermination protein NusG [Alienimonas chondri]